MTHSDQDEKSELFKVLEYLKFLLNEIDKFKDDYEITEEEINTFKNEIVRFKKLAQSNNKLPDEIITDISRAHRFFKWFAAVPAGRGCNESPISASS